MHSSPERDTSTPLLKQYWEIKDQPLAKGALLFFRMGDFYELFGGDAVTAARVLEITLTSRDKNKENPLPMAGVPFHSAAGYIQRLLDSGFKVAIAEQLEEEENPGSGKKLVKREIVRVLTPAIQFEAPGSESNFLGTVFQGRVYLLEPSTGDLFFAKISDLEGISVKHWVLFESEKAPPEIIAGVFQEWVAPSALGLAAASRTLKEQFQIGELRSFFETDSDLLGFGLLVETLLKSQKKSRLSHLKPPRALRSDAALIYGPKTVDHLDLLPKHDRPKQERAATPQDLFSFINRTSSAMGARNLKQRLLAPEKDLSAIANTQQAAQEIHSDLFKAEAIGLELRKVYDLERILSRIETDLASPRDTYALGLSLAAARAILTHLSFRAFLLADLRKELSQASELLAPLTEKILSTQKPEAPFHTRDGSIFQACADPELARLIDLNTQGAQTLIELEARERARTGISSLKVKYNRVFGYFIEVTSTHLKSVPLDYQRKQTTVGGERFFTEELKRFEEETLTAGAKQRALESELFKKLLSEIRTLSDPILRAGQCLADLDALCALARLASEAGWSFPKIEESRIFDVEDSFHPLVEASLKQTGSSMVRNAIAFQEDRHTMILTGPNMGGKSTLMRQAALLVILGQMGAPVPASRARIGIVDRLYTRIGANDAIAKGQSTFMVEMSELAHLLHHGTAHSLILLDEIGRGTSTFDGMSVAWATLEDIATRVRARTLLATHYHELTHLSAELPGVFNMHLAVEAKRPSTLRFLYKLVTGPSSESFGIHVASLAGLPKPVIDRAWKVLHELEKKSNEGSTLQLSLFETETTSHAQPEQPLLSPLIESLAGLKVELMTPLQAMNELAVLQEKARELKAASGP